MRSALVALAILALLTSAAVDVESALGATFCVPTTSASCAGTPEPTVSDAIDASNAAGDHDIIQIAAKSTPYSEDLPPVDDSRPVDIVGAGPTDTVLRPLTPGDSLTTLEVDDPSSTVSNLGIALARGSGTSPGDQEIGLWLASSASTGASATGVAVTAPDPVSNSSGVLLNQNTRFSGGTVTLRYASASSANTGATNAGTVQDSHISADRGVVSRFGGLVRRTRIDADFHGLDAADGASRYEDVTVALVPGIPNPVGLSALPSALSVNATARHVTLAGTGDASGTGASCADSMAFAQSCSLTLDSVVIHGFGKDLKRTAAAAPSNIAVDYSDYDPAKVTDTNSGSGTGAITPGSHNVNADPGFVSSDPSNPLAFHLLARSPLVDAGNPALASDESTTDAAGAPRVAAGRSASPPGVSDIGSLEFQPHAPVAAATGSPTGLAGHSVQFDASGSSDPDPGDALTYFWGFDDGSIAAGPKVSHAFASVGSHTATVTAFDISHRTSTATVSVTILPRPLPLFDEADNRTVRRGARVGFTISAVDADDLAIGLRTLTDRLPSGFKYVRGSATLNGRLITNPSVKGRALTWTSPVRRVRKHRGHRVLGAPLRLTVPPVGELRLHLVAIAPRKTGRYTNRAAADGGPTVAVRTGSASATVRVKAH
jgi:hypothetical protein